MSYSIGMDEKFTFYWHDYETFGASPARDRPSQFAGRRTDAELNSIGEPLMLYCQPSVDMLPHPEAVFITGITPQQALSEGVPEPEFARRIEAELGKPGTCGVGYNSIRFDDEFTRHLLYRNFYDPYQREWFSGNSRWDLIDVVRLCHALRPQGLQWPQDEAGFTRFKLELLTQANGILHSAAHDALSDVDATIGLARKLRAAQPRLFEHGLKLRDKRFAATQLNVAAMTPTLHVSSKIPATRGCLSVIAGIAIHPRNKNEIITVDLSQNPEALIELEADEIHERVFVSNEDLPEGVERILIKGVHLNKSPMLAPISTLSAEQAERWGVDLVRCQQHRDMLFSIRESLTEKLLEVFSQPEPEERDPELSLYGGFLPDADKPRLARVRSATPETLKELEGLFNDARYNELLFRYRARHYPSLLDAADQERWRDFLHYKLVRDSEVSTLTLEQYQTLVQQLRLTETDPVKIGLLTELERWPQESGLLGCLGA
jgi:exodeoxyribonuclease-1